MKWQAASGGSYVYVGGSTFTTTSVASVNNVFTSTYSNYVALIDFVASTGVSCRTRLRASGSDDTNANYCGQYLYLYGPTVDCSRVTGATSFETGAGRTDPSAITIQFTNPFESVKTGIIYDGAGSCGTNIERYAHAMAYNATTSFDGFSIYPTSGTITGIIRVYGVSKS